jgi:hypothetical protein
MQRLCPKGQTTKGLRRSPRDHEGEKKFALLAEVGMGFPLWSFLDRGGASEEGFQRGKPRRGSGGTAFDSSVFPFVVRFHALEQKKGHEIHPAWIPCPRHAFRFLLSAPL